MFIIDFFAILVAMIDFALVSELVLVFSSFTDVLVNAIWSLLLLETIIAKLVY